MSKPELRKVLSVLQSVATRLFMVSLRQDQKGNSGKVGRDFLVNCKIAVYIFPNSFPLSSSYFILMFSFNINSGNFTTSFQHVSKFRLKNH